MYHLHKCKSLILKPTTLVYPKLVADSLTQRCSGAMAATKGFVQLGLNTNVFRSQQVGALKAGKRRQSHYLASRACKYISTQHSAFQLVCRDQLGLNSRLGSKVSSLVNDLPSARQLHATATARIDGALSGDAQTTAVPGAPGFKDKVTEKVADFSELGLCQELQDALAEMEISVPSEIQSIGVPEVIKGGNIVLGSQTGSGKTLAYLLPLIQRLKNDEANGIVTRPKRPRALVLLPTRELTEQVLGVAKELAHHCRFRSAAIQGGERRKEQTKKLSHANDIIVATPGRFLQQVEEGKVHLGDIQYLVLDEADTMFENGFFEDVKKITDVMKRHEESQCIMVAATLTKGCQRIIREGFPDMRTVNAKSLHKAVSGAKHKFLNVPGNEDKVEYLRMVLDGSRKHKRVMVFCNKLDSCRAVEHMLREDGVETYNYHGEMPKDARKEAMAAFLSDAEPEGMVVPYGRQPGPKVLVCTDLAARGLDFKGGSVTHVIQFDFALNSVDYMHRSGRTARAGTTGFITSLVTKRDMVLAQQIYEKIGKGGSLDGLTSDKRALARQKLEDSKKKRSTKEMQMIKREASKMKLHPKLTRGMTGEQIKKLKLKLASKSKWVKTAYWNQVAKQGPKPRSERPKATPRKKGKAGYRNK